MLYAAEELQPGEPFLLAGTMGPADYDGFHQTPHSLQVVPVVVYGIVVHTSSSQIHHEAIGLVYDARVMIVAAHCLR